MKWTIAAVALVLGATAAAQPKTLKKDSIPADAPADVRAAIQELYSGKPVTRAEAAKRLKEMGERAVAAVPFLVDLAEDKKELQIVSVSKNTGSQLGDGRPTTVGQEAAQAVAGLGTAAYAPAAAALKSSSPAARHDVCRAFAFQVGSETRAQQEDPRRLDLILTCLKDPEADVRGQMGRQVYWLRRLADPRVIEALRTLLGDPDPKVREEIGGGLSWRDPHAIDVLIGLLKDPATPADRSGEVRRCLVRLVTKDLGDPAAWEAWWAQNRTKWLNWDPTAPRPRP